MNVAIAELRRALASEAVGPVALVLATVSALIWANSPWASSYGALVETTLTVAIGDWALEKSLLHWINDGLMGVFFFVVGLELKREIVAGELATLRKALLPIIAAVGGMTVPALIYVAINHGTATAGGWGIPMATDIAFALGLLAVFRSRVPTGLFVFLAAVAIVDDIGAIVVIAIFYTDTISMISLIIGFVGFALALLANRIGVRNPAIYLIIGLAVWLAFLKSGVHATLAAVLMAMTIPATTTLHGSKLLDALKAAVFELRDTGLPPDRGLLTHAQHAALHKLSVRTREGRAPLQILEESLAPIVRLIVLPLFALVNAGVVFSLGAFADNSALTIGIVGGLVVGKQLGIASFCFLAVRTGLSELPAGVRWREIHAVSALAGIGFTMSLFIGGLAFESESLRTAAKSAILLASITSAILGTLLLFRSSRVNEASAGVTHRKESLDRI